MEMGFFSPRRAATEDVERGPYTATGSLAICVQGKGSRQSGDVGDLEIHVSSCQYSRMIDVSTHKSRGKLKSDS